MGFPIAIGSKSTSVLPISQTNTAEPNNDDEEQFYQVFSEQCPPLTCFSTCPEGELQAVVSTACGYMVCRKTGMEQNKFAEIRVRISPLCRQLSKSAHRESIFRLPLEIAPTHNDTSFATNKNISPPLQAMFSSDRRFLVCLVPIDECQEEPVSIVVVFRLRLPRKTFDKPLPPTPSYIHTSPENSIETLVATSPRILRAASDEEQSTHPPPFLRATCLCNMRIPSIDSSSLDFKDEPDMLLVGCSDGCVVATSYQTATVGGQLICPPKVPVGIKCMDQITRPTRIRTQRGRVCIIDNDGQLGLFDVEFCACTNNSAEVGEFRSNGETSQSVRDQFANQDHVRTTNLLIDNLLLKVTSRPHHFAFSNSGRIVYALWMTANNMLAVLFQQSDNSTLFVLSCCDQDQDDTECTLLLRVLSQISLNYQSVKESAHTHIVFESLVQAQDHQSHDQRTASLAVKHPLSTCFAPIQYEPTSQCFLINETRTIDAYALLWHWKSNTQGLSIHKTIPSLRGDSCPNVFLTSYLRLAQRKNSNTMFLADITLILSSDWNVKQCIRKDLYEAGFLSPPCDSPLRKNRFIDFNSPVFLTAKTVAFPRLKRRSIRDECELEWTEASLPSHIRSPGMSAFGRRWGRSIAIAGDVGMCIVDLGGKPAPLSDARRNGFHASDRSSTTFIKSTAGNTSDNSSASRIQGRDCPRWYQFGNGLTAKSFQVASFSWWEGCEVGMAVHDFLFDDILIAVLRTQHDGEVSYFLSCWSKSKLDLNHQLLRDLNDAYPSQWGVKLAPEFIPSKLSVFGQPHVSDGSSRKAYVLLSSDDDVTGYLCFQLQMIPAASNRSNSRNYRDTRPYKILGVVASQGSIGGPADIFIAGANFNFDLTVSCPRGDPDSHLATIGVARELGAGLDAMALSRYGVSHFGEVISSCCNDARSSSVSTMWQSLSVEIPGSTTTQPTSVWVIHLLDDSIVTWIVPSFDGEEGESESDQELYFSTMESSYSSAHFLVPVHAASRKLGWRALSGKASDWMQNPTKATSMDFPLGPLQLGSFDCMIGVTQHCLKLHRSVDENNESLLFRCDFLDNEIFAPGAFRIKPPGFLPVFYSVAKHMTVGGIWNGGTVLQNYSMSFFQHSTSHEACMLAIQVFFFRVLERLKHDMASLLNPSQCLLQNVLISSVDISRTVSSPLHFSMLFLEVGRQIEPSCLGNLFPLPGRFRTDRHEEVLDLLEIALDQGALDLATATLPLLPTQQVTTQYCQLILRVLLHELVDRRGASKMGVNLKQDMRIAGDLFRYALKISVDDSASDRFHYDIDDEEEIQPPSVICALSNFFLRGKGEAKIEKAAATFIINGFEDDLSSSSESSTSLSVDACVNVACCAIDALIEAVLPASNETDWRQGALTARFLLGLDGGARKLTPENPISQKITCTAPIDIETGGILQFLRKEITECTKQIRPGAASAIVDLVVLACGNLNHQNQIPDQLVSILLVCLHCSNRSQELLDSVADDGQLHDVFLCSENYQ